MKIKKLIGLLVIISSILLTSCGVGPAVKELKKVNDEAARYWIQFIKKNGINAIDRDGDILLVSAAEANNLPLVKACIKSGANVNLYPQYKYTALELAVKHDNPEMIQVLLKNKAVMQSDDKDILNLIARLRNALSKESVDIILHNCKNNMLDYSNSKRNLLEDIEGGDFFKSSYEFNTYFFEQLYSKGYKPSKKDYGLIFCLYFLSKDNETQKICEQYLTKFKNTEVSTNFQDFTGWSQQGYSEEWICKILRLQIEYGADVESNYDPIFSALNSFTGNNFIDALNLAIECNVKFESIDIDRILSHLFEDNITTIYESLNIMQQNQMDLSSINNNLRKLYRNVELEDFINICNITQCNKKTFVDYERDLLKNKYEINIYVDPYWDSQYINKGVIRPHKDNIKGLLDELELLEENGFDIGREDGLYETYITLYNKI